MSTGDNLSGTVACTMPSRYLGSKPTPARGSFVALHIASLPACAVLSRCHRRGPRSSAEMTISISQGAVVENSGSRLDALDQRLGSSSWAGGSSSSRVAEQTPGLREAGILNHRVDKRERAHMTLISRFNFASSGDATIISKLRGLCARRHCLL